MPIPPTRSTIPRNDANQRVAGILPDGLLECPCCDEFQWGGSVRVSPFGGKPLPRPFGATSGSCAKGESGQLPMLYHGYAFGADVRAGGIQFPGGVRFGFVGNWWTLGSSTFGRVPICAYACFVAQRAGLGGAIVVFVCPGTFSPRESAQGSNACACPHSFTSSQTFSSVTYSGNSAGSHQSLGCQSIPTFPLALAI